MALPSEKLANSLEALKALQDKGIVAIRSADLSRGQHAGAETIAGQVKKGWK
ncbi:hypothetical protein [uncultured Kiloniella sp.]|uniref:hypothetical protein n=1 Tax=uncultured Kiloniella sp. TaxID=1133091 RepID=UPI002633E038|nr:hypothetical protein [uncultured Kiloniella sp.]